MSGSRILVVEDDIRLATTLERVLTTEGHQVELAGDGLEALRRAREQPFDLVGSLLLLVLPIGANHGPVALMTNVALPVALVLLLRKPREAFA
jgi:CheY-like chemotaxis protein